MEKPGECAICKLPMGIHRSQLLKAPRRDTCCEWGGGGGGGGGGGWGGGEREVHLQLFNIAMNYNRVLNQFFFNDI